MADRTVAVDFDGVIHAYSKGWQDGSIYDAPHPGALDGLRKLMDHYAVFVHTSRDTLAVAAWLASHGMTVATDPAADVRFWTERGVLLVTQRKLPAVAYLDDRAVRFTSWAAALRVLLPDESRDAQERRIADRLGAAWPFLADDPVFLDQLAAEALAAIDGRPS